MTALTLVEALGLPQAVCDELEGSALHLSAEEVRAAGALWLALLGLADDGSAAARAAWFECVQDRPLCVALHRDAVELLKWWRGADWAGFDRSDPGGESWAWQVLDRLRAVVGSLGCWAGQVVLSADLVREVCGDSGGLQGMAVRRIEITAPGIDCQRP